MYRLTAILCLRSIWLTDWHFKPLHVLRWQTFNQLDHDQSERKVSLRSSSRSIRIDRRWRRAVRARLTGNRASKRDTKIDKLKEILGTWQRILGFISHKFQDKASNERETITLNDTGNCLWIIFLKAAVHLPFTSISSTSSQSENRGWMRVTCGSMEHQEECCTLRLDYHSAGTWFFFRHS